MIEKVNLIISIKTKRLTVGIKMLCMPDALLHSTLIYFAFRAPYFSYDFESLIALLTSKCTVRGQKSEPPFI